MSAKLGHLNLESSLANNIFIKEDQLQANKNNQQFTNIVRTTRVALVVIFSCIFIVFVIINGQMRRAESQIVRHSYMLNAYRYPMSITINYIRQFLKIGDTPIVNLKIVKSTEILL